MSDPNEHPEATQQGGRSAQDAGRPVEATEAAERRAEELQVDLAGVEGTGAGGRITATDVQNAHQQPDTTTGHVETFQGGGSQLAGVTPSLDDIQRQYIVLKATLAGPKDGVLLTIIKEDGNSEDLTTTNNFPDNPTNFFAPAPPIVKWFLPRPQRPVPKTLPGTNQPCRTEEYNISVS